MRHHLHGRSFCLVTQMDTATHAGFCVNYIIDLPDLNAERLATRLERELLVPIRYRQTDNGFIFPVHFQIEDKDTATTYLKAFRSHFQFYERRLEDPTCLRLERADEPDDMTTVFSDEDAAEYHRKEDDFAKQCAESARLNDVKREPMRRRQQAVEAIQNDPDLSSIFCNHNPKKTVALLVYRMARQLEATPTTQQVEELLNNSKIKTAFGDEDWLALIELAQKHCQRSYKAPERTHDFWKHLDHLKKLVTAETLAAASVKITHEDLAIALTYYNLRISGAKGTANAGQAGSNVLPNWFKGVKKWTGQGCNKQKALVLHKMMIDFDLIRPFGIGYCPKKFRKTYTFGQNNPLWTDKPVTGWESVPTDRSHVPHVSSIRT